MSFSTLPHFGSGTSGKWIQVSMDSVETSDPAVANKTLTSFWMASSFLTAPLILPTTNLSCGLQVDSPAGFRCCSGMGIPEIWSMMFHHQKLWHDYFSAFLNNDLIWCHSLTFTCFGASSGKNGEKCPRSKFWASAVMAEEFKRLQQPVAFEMVRSSEMESSKMVLVKACMMTHRWFLMRGSFICFMESIRIS